MIAKIRRGSYFKGLYDYLMTEAKGLANDDFELRNIVSVETAAVEMRLAAGRSRRVEKPVYHLILGWHENEHPSRDEMFEICHELVERLGLENHQALFRRDREAKSGATPGDGRHYEMHMIINRIGPNGRAAKMSNDFALVERAVADIAEARSMRVVPGRFNGRAGFAQGSSEGARSVAASTGRLSLAMQLRDRPDVMAEFVGARAEGWPALIRALTRHGIALEESNRTVRPGQSAGLVITSMVDADHREKISALDTPDVKWGRPTLERELGAFPVEVAAAARVLPYLTSGSAQTATQPVTDKIRADFTEARDAALNERKQIGKLHQDSKRRLSNAQAQERKKLISIAAQRRGLIAHFFGRRSEVGAAINRVLDQRSANRLTEVMDEHRRERRKIEDRHRDALERLPVPTWADWRRAAKGEDRSAGGQRGSPAPQKQDGVTKKPNQHSDSQPLDTSATSIAMAFDEHVRRRKRLARNRERKAALERGDIDARVAAIADQLCVAVAAEVIRHFHAKTAVRTTVLILAAIASGSAIAPAVLAAAAVAVLRRDDLQGERTGLRADVDAAKAARTGWRFTDVLAADRARYAALARSDLMRPGGTDPAPIIAAVGQHQAARFVAWWAYASDAQRHIIEGWHKTRHPRQQATGRKPKQRGKVGWER